MFQILSETTAQIKFFHREIVAVPVTYRLLKGTYGQSVTKTIIGQIKRYGGITAGGIAGNAINFVITISSGSIGTLVAKGIDGFDNRNNGYVFC